MVAGTKVVVRGASLMVAGTKMLVRDATMFLRLMGGACRMVAMVGDGVNDTAALAEVTWDVVRMSGVFCSVAKCMEWPQHCSKAIPIIGLVISFFI